MQRPFIHPYAYSVLILLFTVITTVKGGHRRFKPVSNGFSKPTRNQRCRRFGFQRYPVSNQKPLILAVRALGRHHPGLAAARPCAAVSRTCISCLAGQAWLAAPRPCLRPRGSHGRTGPRRRAGARVARTGAHPGHVVFHRRQDAASTSAATAPPSRRRWTRTVHGRRSPRQGRPPASRPSPRAPPRGRRQCPGSASGSRPFRCWPPITGRAGVRHGDAQPAPAAACPCPVGCHHGGLLPVDGPAAQRHAGELLHTGFTRT